MVFKLDQENQALRRQDCYILFMQNYKALLPHLVEKAKQWHHQMSQSDQAMKDVVTYVPLWAVLMQALAQTLQTRLVKFSQCEQTDRSFSWRCNTDWFTRTGHSHSTVGMCSRRNYWKRISRRSQCTECSSTLHSWWKVEATVKFHSLRSQETKATVPWLCRSAFATASSRPCSIP